MATIPVSRHGDSPDGSGHGCKGPLKYLDLKVGDVDGLYSEGSTRWGVKRKVDAVTELTHTYSEHCDRHLRDKLNDLYLRRVLASNSEVSFVPFNFMQSQRGQWASTSPPPLAYPTPPKLGDLYGLQVCSARGVSLKRPVSCINGLKDPKPFKIHQSRSSGHKYAEASQRHARTMVKRKVATQLRLISRTVVQLSTCSVYSTHNISCAQLLLKDQIELQKMIMSTARLQSGMELKVYCNKCQVG
jgi:hypothetical protein